MQTANCKQQVTSGKIDGCPDKLLKVFENGIFIFGIIDEFSVASSCRYLAQTEIERIIIDELTL